MANSEVVTDQTLLSCNLNLNSTISTLGHIEARFPCVPLGENVILLTVIP